MEKLDADTQEIYKYKIYPKCVQDKLTELQDRSCRDNAWIDGGKETKEERWYVREEKTHGMFA